MIRPLKAIGLAGCVLCSFFLIVSCSALKTEKKLKSEREISKNTVISPSFDCAKATTEVEKLICSDAELAELDREMAKAYSELNSSFSKKKDQKQLSRRQRIWLNNRSKVPCMIKADTAQKKECLRHVYEYRIQKLIGWNRENREDFYIAYENIKPDFKFISNNGEEINILFFKDVDLKYTTDYTIYSYPKADEKIFAYTKQTSFSPKNIHLIKHTDKEIILSLGDLPEEEKQLYKTDKKIPVTGTYKFAVKMFPVEPFWAGLMTGRYWSAIQLFPIFSDIEAQGDIEAQADQRETCLFLSDCFYSKPSGNMNGVDPDYSASSFEELLKKANITCENNSVKNDKNWYPPYMLFKLNDSSFLMAAPYLNNNVINKYKFIKIDNKCNIVDNYGDDLNAPMVLEMYPNIRGIDEQRKDERILYIAFLPQKNKMILQSTYDDIKCIIPFKYR